jgi:hypothetical protein
MSSQIEKWNQRAGFLLTLLGASTKGQPSPIERARATLAHWRMLVEAVPHRALSAAAHQGLTKGGAVTAAVENLRRGCLTLAGTAGGGKTVGGAWLAYHGTGSVLWLDAVAVGSAHPDQIVKWRAEIPGHGLVVLDDVGAGSSSGDWSSRKVADVLTAILERLDKSVVAMNLDRAAFTVAMDGRDGGRLGSRMRMAPNVWLDIRCKDRRLEAVVPPDIDVLPPREAEAHTVMQSSERLAVAQTATRMIEVDEPALAAAAKALGFARWADVDRALAEREQRLAELEAASDRCVAKLRLVVPAADREDEPSTPLPGEQQRKRVALLDLVANVAERRGIEEHEVLRELGRERRSLSVEDEPRLLAMLGGRQG